MYLPEYIRFAMDRLEKAGFGVYAVGGCVRDSLLGNTPQDYDLCTSAAPEETEAVFADLPLVLTGKKHGTVSVILDHRMVEITTFRKEGAYGDNRHPDSVEFLTDIRQDLARRDFTVNAMAYHPREGIVDPFGGRQDLQNKVLRAVGDPLQRFREDSLRILRGVRFGVRFGLQPEEETFAAMISEKRLMDNLARERVFSELNRLLPQARAEDLIRFAPILSQVIPELAPMVGFDQKNPHHAYDLFTHTAYVVERVPEEPALRWAALLHDTGKVDTFTLDAQGIGHFYGHGAASGKIAEDVLLRLKAPTALRERVVLLTEQHMTLLQPDKAFLRRRLSRLGWETTLQLLQLQEADCGGKEVAGDVDFARVRQLLEELRQENACLKLSDLQVNGHDLMAMGIPAGRRIGEILNFLLRQVLEEKLPNEREALLEAGRNQYSLTL